MAWKAHFDRPLERLRWPDCPPAPDPVESCLAQIDRACREIAFCELADVIAGSRISALRKALSHCREEERRDAGAGDLDSRTVEAELASLEQTLPLEQAYRADQRDLAIARLTEAQSRLRVGCTSEAEMNETLKSRVRAALTISAAEMVAISRDRAVARVAQIW